MDFFECLNPMDYRYYGRSKSKDTVAKYLSENARIKYQAAVESAIVKTLAKMGVCSQSVSEEVEQACQNVQAQEVYAEEDRIKHDIRALTNMIRSKVSDGAKPFVHLGATSFDIINTAEAKRIKDFCSDVLTPAMLALEKTLIELALRERATVQIGRTHGQHAEPITFGFALAEYVSRLGNRIVEIGEKANDLRGKMSGAVGAYNAASLYFEMPEEFEAAVLAELTLKPSTHSTQVVEPEYMLDLVHSVISAFGVIANLADDMRALQRSEIAEVGEAFGDEQVGSSTMPHKRNPINFENVKSMWKAMMPRMSTLYMDQISEHQRDLTNSASSRFVPEIFAAFLNCVERLNGVMKKMAVDKDSMARNFEMSSRMIIAEPLYVFLAAFKHPDAHEYVRKLTLKSSQSGTAVMALLREDPSMQGFLQALSEKQRAILENPENYIGLSVAKTEKVCEHWRRELGI